MAITCTVLLAGCLQAAPSTGDGDSELPPSSPTRTTKAALDASYLPTDSSWILIEATLPDSGGTLDATANWQWAIDPNAETESLRGCAAVAGGVDGEGVGLVYPVWTRHDSLEQTAPVWIQSQGYSAGHQVNGAGGFQVNWLTALGTRDHSTADVLFGMSGRQHWPEGTLTGSIEAFGEEFKWAQIESGSLWCVSELHEFTEGTIVSTPTLTAGTGLQKSFDLQHGAAIWLHVRSDVSHDVSIIGPDGEQEWTSTTDLPGSYVERTTLVCSEDPGTWTIHVDEIAGASHVTAQVSAIVIDATDRALGTMDCNGNHHQWD